MTERVFVRNRANLSSEVSENKLVLYVPYFSEYGLPVYDGGSSFILIKYCPWCKTKLPNSRRDKWIDAMSLLGYDLPLSQKIPKKYFTEDWERYLLTKSLQKAALEKKASKQK